MSVLNRMISTLRTLAHSRAAQDDVAEEMRFHAEQHAAELESQGVPPAEAQRRARAALGTHARNVGERHREMVGLRLFDEVRADVRYGLRGLWRNKSFALIAILSMALGIGAATAMFSVVYAVLLDIYPYADANRTVNPVIFDPEHPDDWRWFMLSREQIAQYRAAPCFDDVFAQGSLNMQLDEDGVQVPIRITTLSGNAAQFNRVPALLGRNLQPSDGDFGGKPSDVAVLSYRFWKKKYGGDSAVIGRNFKAGKALYRIVGVMPERYTLGGSPDLYLPIAQFDSPGSYYVTFAKLKPGVTPKQASAYINPMIHEFAKQTPSMYPKNFHTDLQLLIEGFTSRSKMLKHFPLLYVAVSALLLIGCANCSLLLLARGTSRVHEFSLRCAVGASRFRLIRQLLVECLMIALLGSVLGTAFAYVLARLPLQLAADLFPSEAVIRINGTVLGFSVTVALLAGVLFGLLPAVKFSHPEISTMLNANSRRTMTAAGKRPLQTVIGAQIALTLVLLTVSIAAISGFLHFLRMPLGYDPSNMLSVGVGLYQSTTAVPKWTERVAKINAIEQAVKSVPGVVSASTADDTPPSGGGLTPFELLDSDSRGDQARYTSIGTDYFRTLGIPLIQGRTWTASEAGAGLPLAVVNRAFVRRFSPGRSILDRVVRVPSLDPLDIHLPSGITFSPSFHNSEIRIIGVSEDAVNDGLDKPVLPNLYVDRNVLLFGYAPMLVRTAYDPHSFSRSIAHAIQQAAGAESYIYINPLTLQDIVEHETAYRTQRLVAVLLSIFAFMALALSLVGLYSVVSYVVSRRTSEFGIRIALGAQRGQILGLVLRSNLAVILGGTAAGVLASLLIRARFAQWSQYSSRSPLLILLAALLLVVSALLASLLPARRAAFVQPVEALRAE